MGGKATSGSAYSPPRAPRPPRAPIPRPPFLRLLIHPRTLAASPQLEWLERWVHESPVVDWLYLAAFAAALLLAGYILAVG